MEPSEFAQKAHYLHVHVATDKLLCQLVGAHWCVSNKQIQDDLGTAPLRDQIMRIVTLSYPREPRERHSQRALARP